MRTRPDHAKQQGFALVAAIFLVVVLASALVLMAHLASIHQSFGIMGIQGARAYFAARSGIEWATNQLVGGQSCANINNQNFILDDFKVTVTCTSAAGINTVNATADNSTRVAPGQPEYAWRRIQAVIR